MTRRHPGAGWLALGLLWLFLLALFFTTALEAEGSLLTGRATHCGGSSREPRMQAKVGMPAMATVSDNASLKEGTVAKQNTKDDDAKAMAGSREKLGVTLPADLAERARDAAYWTRGTLVGLIEAGLRSELARLEKANGGAFDPRESELRTGRKPKGTP
jgi:hypothetical protein